MALLPIVLQCVTLHLIYTFVSWATLKERVCLFKYCYKAANYSAVYSYLWLQRFQLSFPLSVGQVSVMTEPIEATLLWYAAVQSAGFPWTATIISLWKWLWLSVLNHFLNKKLCVLHNTMSVRNFSHTKSELTCGQFPLHFNYPQ